MREYNITNESRADINKTLFYLQSEIETELDLAQTYAGSTVEGSEAEAIGRAWITCIENILEVVKGL